VSAPGPAPRVSIVVPCRNERDSIGTFLESALAQRGIPGGFEIIVADGCSDDGTREILDEWASRDHRLRVVENLAMTVSPGLNAAIRLARGAIIVRMDVHSVYAHDYVLECVSALENTGAQNVGGPALTLARTPFQRANAAAYASPFSVGGARFHNPGYEGPVDTVTYGCWRRDTLMELGLFDEDLVRNQDDELNLRLTRRGGRIWQTPRIRSWYQPRSSLSAVFRQYFQYGYWKVRVIRKHRLPASWRHLVPVAAIGAAFALAVAGLFDRRAWYALAALVTVYVGLSAGASVLASRNARSWTVIPWLPLVFAAYHAGYGLGFALGLFDQLTRRGSGSSSVTSLTR
jgi:succinoglycan biosynthesis protein ExoA